MSAARHAARQESVEPDAGDDADRALLLRREGLTVVLGGDVTGTVLVVTVVVICLGGLRGWDSGWGSSFLISIICTR